MTNLFFAWVNFGITILIGRYVYRRWIRTQLHTSIQADKDKIKNLHSEAGGLEDYVKELCVDLVLQENQAGDLLTKLKLWRKTFNDAQSGNVQEFAVTQEVILQRNELKLKNLALSLAQKKVLSSVLIEANSILHDKFAKDVESSLLLRHIIYELDQH